MFGQVLICVLRGGLEIIIHPWGDRRRSWGLPSGRIPGPGPAPCLLTCAICNEDSRSPFEEFCCQPAKRETQRERQAGSLAKQSGVQFPEQDHSVFVGTREGACGCKEVEGQFGNCIFLFTSSGSSNFQCSSILWKLGAWKNPLWILYGGLFSAFLLPWLCSEGKRWDDDQVKLVLR